MDWDCNKIVFHYHSVFESQIKDKILSWKNICDKENEFVDEQKGVGNSPIWFKSCPLSSFSSYFPSSLPGKHTWPRQPSEASSAKLIPWLNRSIGSLVLLPAWSSFHLQFLNSRIRFPDLFGKSILYRLITSSPARMLSIPLKESWTL